jgi:very-short-patch-repair endonuclease
LAGVEPGVFEITVPKGKAVRRRGVIVHQARDLRPVDVTVVDAIPVTTPTRTLIDLGAVVPKEAVEEALDDALRRGLTSIPRLRWRIGELATRGRRGVGVVRELVDRRAGDPAIPESVLETRLLRLIEREGLPAPVRQYQVRERGRLIAIPDFAYPDLKLAIEADGYRWHSGREQWESDLARRNALTARGWRVVHVTYRDLEHRPDEVVRTIARALAGPPPGASPARAR